MSIRQMHRGIVILLFATLLVGITTIVAWYRVDSGSAIAPPAAQFSRSRAPALIGSEDQQPQRQTERVAIAEDDGPRGGGGPPVNPACGSCITLITVDAVGCPVPGVKVELWRWRAMSTQIDGVIETGSDGAHELCLKDYGPSDLSRRFLRIPMLSSESIMQEVTPGTGLPIQLIVPPVTKLIVRLAGDDTQWRGASFSIAPFLPRAPTDVAQVPAMSKRFNAKRGKAEFIVARGSRLLLTAIVGNGVRVKRIIEGAEIASETSEIVVSIPPEGTRYRVRLVASDSVPISDASINAFLVQGRASVQIHGSRVASTDSYGFIEFATACVGGSGPAILYVEGRRGRTVVEGSLPIPENPGGLRDLGDLVMTIGAPIVAGVVLDSNRRPVAGLGVVLESGAGDGSVSDWTGYESATDIRGRFEIHGRVMSQVLGVRVFRDGIDAGSCLVAAGDMDVEIVIGAEGEVSGSVVCDPRAFRSLGVSARALRGSSSVVHHHVAEDGTFSVTSPPGMYDIVITNMSAGTPLAIIQDIEMVANGHERDNRLQALDLSGVLRVFSIELVSDGRGDLSGSLETRSVDVFGRARAGDMLFKGNKFDVVGRPEGVEVTIRVEGYEPVQRMRIQEDFTRIVLAGGMPVEVHLPEGVRMPADNGNWLLSCAFGENDHSLNREQEASRSFDSTGTCRVRAPKAGVESCRLYVVMYDAEKNGEAVCTVMRDIEVTIPPGGGLVQLPVDAFELQAALEAALVRAKQLLEL